MTIETKDPINAGIYSVNSFENKKESLNLNYNGNKEIVFRMTVAQAESMIKELRDFISNKNRLKY